MSPFINASLMKRFFIKLIFSQYGKCGNILSKMIQLSRRWKTQYSKKNCSKSSFTKNLPRSLVMKENYQFKDSRFIIQDSELGINIDTSFSPRMIPSDFSKSPEMVVKEGAEGRGLRAYFEVEGKFEGQYLLYYPDGTIETECYYLKSELHGPSRFFSESGICLSESWFYHGKKEGKSTRRFLSGKLSTVERYKKGLHHGKQDYYYENGANKTAMTYKDGILEGEVSLYWPSGAKKRKVTFQIGLREGFDRMWSATGILLDEGKYQRGDPVGLHRRFYEDGTPQEERQYHSSLSYDLKKWDSSWNTSFRKE